MPAKSSVTFLLLLAAASPSVGVAQTHDDLTLNVTDLGDPDAPIKLSVGQFTFKQDIYSGAVNTTCKRHLELTNTSFRTVLAYEITVRPIAHYPGGIPGTDRNDRFFSSDLTFVPGSRETLDDDCSSKIRYSRDDERGNDIPVTPRPLCLARSLSLFSVSGVKCISMRLSVRQKGVPRNPNRIALIRR
jgi:hypothetical protein